MDFPVRKDNMHKPIPLRFGNIAEARAAENQFLITRRKNNRSNMYSLNRKLQTMETGEVPALGEGIKKLTTKPDLRRQRLMEWKRERELKAVHLKQQRKPQFKVGIMHHHVASPFRDLSNATTVVARSVMKMKVDLAAQPKCMRGPTTRAQQRHQLNSAILAFPFKSDKVKPFHFNPSLTIPKSPRFMERERQKTSTLKKLRSDIGKVNGAVSAKCPPIVPQHLSSSPEPLAQPLSPEQEASQAIVVDDVDFASESYNADEVPLGLTGTAPQKSRDNANRLELPVGDNTMVPPVDATSPICNSSVMLTATGKKPAEVGDSGERMSLCQFVPSPFVELERGKHRRRLTDSNGRSPVRTCVLPSYSSVSSPSQSQLHRQRLESETARLLAECDRWCNLAKDREDDLPVEVVGEIDSVTGQTRLLTHDKFAQFRTLIDRCETPDSQQVVVTTDDLDGFWDTMYLQVLQLDKRFAKLEDLKANNWVEMTPVDESASLAGKKLTFTHGARVKQASKKPVKSSGIRQLIEQARLKMKSGSGAEEPLLLVSGGGAEKINTFDGVFFKVQSPQASNSNIAVTPTAVNCQTAEITPTSQCGTTMLRRVLSCEAYRRLNASNLPHKLTSLHSVFIAKTISSPLVNVLSDDSLITPKSILKRKINGLIENQSDEELLPAHMKTVLFKDCEDNQPNLALNNSDDNDDVFWSASNSQTFQTPSNRIKLLTLKEESEKPKQSSEECETLSQSNEAPLSVKQQTVQEHVTPRLMRLSTIKKRMSFVDSAEIPGSSSVTSEIITTLLQLNKEPQPVEQWTERDIVTPRVTRLSTMKKRMSYMKTAEVSSSSSAVSQITKTKNTSATHLQFNEGLQTVMQQTVQELVSPRLTRSSTLRQKTPHPSRSPVVSPKPVSANYKGTPRPGVKRVSSILRPSILDVTVNTFTVPKVGKRSKKARRHQSSSKIVDERQEDKCDLSLGTSG